MTKYIWQNEEWPRFKWDSEKILSPLAQARRAQGFIIGQGNFLDLESEASVFVEEAFTTSAIEGEHLDRDSIRSSVAQRLGLPTAGLPQTQIRSDGLVEVLIDATRNFGSALTAERLFGWHAAIFPTAYSGIRPISVGSWRCSSMPMQVISGPIGREKVYYEAPPASHVETEMTRFLRWFNNPPTDLDGLIRAALAHFWFVTIHPFEDGNGRLCRTITDMALSQDEKSGRRLYSLSSQIIKNRKSYYEILEQSQKSDCDITSWIVWFLEIFTISIESSKELIEKSIFIGRYFKFHAGKSLNSRQEKVVRKLLEYYPREFEGGLTNRKYVNICKTSSESAKRDLKDLVEKGFIIQNEGGGRSVSYRINERLSDDKV